VFAVWIETGYRDYARHVAYLHFCGLVHDLFGGSGFAALRLASAIGSAFGLFCLHRAFVRLPLGNLHSALVPALAVLVTPAWFFYATSAEVPGVFAAGVGASWWAFARWLDAPAPLRAIGLGAATAFAGSLHAFGHVLAPSFALIAIVWRALPATGRSLQLLCLLATHAVLAFAVSTLLGSGAGDQAHDAMGHLEERWATFAPQTVLTVFWREWLVPYGPWSIAAFAALAVLRARSWALAVVVLLAVHLPLVVLLLGFIDVDESGAYLLALALPAVLATAHLVPARSFVACLAASAALAACYAAPGWRDPISPEFSAGIAELYHDRRPAIVVIGPDELAGVRIVPGAVAMELAGVVGVFMQSRQPDETFEVFFDRWWASLESQQLPVLLTEATRDYFEKGPDRGLQTFWREHVLQRYRVTPEHRRGFHGVWIERK